MRHSLVTVRMLEQARAALDDEAASRPVPQPKPPPRTRPATGRLAMTARTLARRALASPPVPPERRPPGNRR